MEQLATKGQFHAISSFAIKARGEFYVIGQLVNGEVQADWFVEIPLNSALSFELKIKQVEVVEMVGDTTEYLLLIIDDNGKSFFSPFQNVNIGSEYVNIVVEGYDWSDEE